MRTKHSVTTAVIAKRPSRAVRLPRVHLDDHSLTVPHEVALHLLARDLHPGVDRWGRQAGLPSELEETLFELTLGSVTSKSVDLKCCSQAGGARMRAPALEQLTHRPHVANAVHLAPVAGAVKDVRRRGGSDGQKRGGHARACDPVHLDAVLRDEARGTVNADAGSGDRGPPRDGHVDRPAFALRSPCRVAADWCESKAPSPQASTAAIHLPMIVTSGRPTA